MCSVGEPLLASSPCCAAGVPPKKFWFSNERRQYPRLRRLRSLFLFRHRLFVFVLPSREFLACCFESALASPPHLAKGLRAHRNILRADNPLDRTA
jgi:hypothetical protein